MKKIIFIFCLSLFGLSSSLAFENEADYALSENLSETEFFCEAGWDDVEDYFEAGGDDGFYAGYLYCYHCPGEC